METIKAYQVVMDSMDGGIPRTLGYAQGNEREIEEYFADRPSDKPYIRLQPIKVLNVTRDAVAERNGLLEEKAAITARLGELEALLKT